MKKVERVYYKCGESNDKSCLTNIHAKIMGCADIRLIDKEKFVDVKSIRHTQRDKENISKKMNTHERKTGELPLDSGF